MSRKFTWILIAFIIVVGGVIAWKIKKHAILKNQSALNPVQVTSGPIQEAVEATGEAAPLNRVEIKPPIGGRIDKLLVDEGDGVRTGQILAYMSSTDRAAILDAARAQGPAALKQWVDAYKPTPIFAPLSGTIILRNVVVGQTVDASTVLYAMSDVLIVIAQVDESDIGRIKPGMTARVILDAYPNRMADGVVFQILEEGKNVSNVITYDVKIKLLPKAPSYYRSQMTANISFLVQNKDKAVLVPLTAVHDTPAGAKEVWVPDANGKPVPRDITVGIQNDTQAEVVSGLQPGDTVLVKGVKYVPQQAVQTSPLTMGGRPPASGQSGGGQRRQ